MKGEASAERCGTMDGGVCARSDFGGGGSEKGEHRFLIGEPRARRSSTGSKPEGRFDVRGGLAQGTPGCTSECAPHGSSPGRPAGRDTGVGCSKVEGSSGGIEGTTRAGAIEPGTVGARAESAAKAAEPRSVVVRAGIAWVSTPVATGDWTTKEKDANNSSSSSITASQSVFPPASTVSAAETTGGMLMGTSDIREAFAAGPAAPEGTREGRLIGERSGANTGAERLGMGVEKDWPAPARVPGSAKAVASLGGAKS